MTTSETKALNNFQEYGFTAGFEGEIYSKKCTGITSDYFGAIFFPTGWKQVAWDCDGKIRGFSSSFNLTPIKKEWYEYPENFPALITNGTYMFITVNSKEAWLEEDGITWRLATKAELMSLYVEED